jgi:hypothetical protein
MTGDFGESYTRTVVETGWRCLYIPHGNRDRCGIDATVIDVLNGRVQPLQFSVQVKTGKFRNIRDSHLFRAPVSSEDLAFWRELETPIILVCVDTNPPTTAYWHLIRPDTKMPLQLSKRKVFGPGSRDAVVGAIRKAINRNKEITLRGRTLSVRLNSGIRGAAKECYRRLKSESHNHPTYGPITFTWKGWRHITRKKRLTRKIAQALLLLPTVPEILNSPIQPKDSRELEPVRRGKRIFSRTLLVFEPTITLKHRSDARVRLVIERDTVFPEDWATTDPSDRRRVQICRFYSLSELPPKRNDRYE